MKGGEGGRGGKGINPLFIKSQSYSLFLSHNVEELNQSIPENIPALF